MADEPVNQDGGLDPQLEGGAESETPDPSQGGGEATPDGSQQQSWTKEQQAAYTRKTQELANQRKEFEQQRQQFETQRQQAAQQLQQYWQRLQQHGNQGQTQQQQADLFDKLQSMDFVDGRTAYQLAQRLSQGFQPLGQNVQQVQKQNQWLYQQLGQLQKVVEQLEGGRRESSFSSLIANTRAELGLPDSDVVNEAIKDVYLSHQEDDDLRENFTSLVKDRMEGLRKTFFEDANTRARKAKDTPLAKRAGSASPTGENKRGYRNPEQLADDLWPLLEEAGRDQE